MPKFFLNLLLATFFRLNEHIYVFKKFTLQTGQRCQNFILSIQEGFILKTLLKNDKNPHKKIQNSPQKKTKKKLEIQK